MLEFRTFVENKNKKVNAESFDRDKRINDYVQLVNQLYSDIDHNWLAEYIPDKIKTGLERMTLHEDALGNYDVEKKWLQIGNSRLYLIPVGTILIGTTARVDLVCGARSVMIMWIDQRIKTPFDVIKQGRAAKHKDAKFSWKMVDRNGSVHYEDVDSNSFQKTIMRLLDE